MSTTVTIRFEPEGRKVKVKSGLNIFEIAKKVGVKIRSECGGEGSCGKCRVVVEDQSGLTEVSENELQLIKPKDLGRGYRLACRAMVNDDIVVFVPPESRVGVRKIQVEGMERPVELDPVVKKVHLMLSKPSVDDMEPDFDRLAASLQKRGLNQPEIDHELLRALPDVLRDAEWNITATVWNNKRIISVEKGNTSNVIYGFSVDIGTSKIVGYLVDLTSGDVISIRSLENPQMVFGEDIISRVYYAMSDKEASKRLQEMTIGTINKLITEACQETNINPNKIYEVTVVGNTVMHHLFLGIQLKYLALAPYVPTIKRPIDIKAGSLKIETNPHANVHVLPVIAGFVGADAIADILATGIHETDEMCLLMDIGTNGEVLVGNREDIVACSCAAGPAFEDMHIKHGMKAATGAIEKLKINPDTWEVKYETIDGAKPVGICGSGIIDAVAEMFRCAIIDQDGRFSKNIRTPRLRHVNGKPEFIIAWKHETESDTDITISQKDIQEIQLAKAAMHTGAAILMEKKEVTEKDLDRVYIAGAFGRCLNAESARFIGLIPDVPSQKIAFVGNTAISGAKMALTSKEIRETAQKLSTNVRYVELAAAPSFHNEFLSSMFFPHRDMRKYPTVTKIISSARSQKSRNANQK